MIEKEVLTLVTALGAPVLIALGGIFTWFLKSRKEELQAIEERTLERRIETYHTILHPIMLIFSNIGDEKMISKATNQIKSVEYRKAGFDLITFGSDEMVVAYNKMMQGFFKNVHE